jgi:hypothetical protein
LSGQAEKKRCVKVVELDDSGEEDVGGGGGREEDEGVGDTGFPSSSQGTRTTETVLFTQQAFTMFSRFTSVTFSLVFRAERVSISGKSSTVCPTVSGKYG